MEKLQFTFDESGSGGQIYAIIGDELRVWDEFERSRKETTRTCRVGRGDFRVSPSEMTDL
jgi:hypothetical protein